MTTKRRKVWVNFYGGEYGKSDTFRAVTYMQHGRAVAYGNGAETAAFLERLPGDVVLSREEVASLRYALEQVGQSTPRGSDDANRVSHWLALLRGRR